jgi:hypothetical protein
MRSFIVAITALLVATSSASTSFQKDVVRRVHARKGKVQKQRQVNDALLEKAVPVADFEKKHGVSLGRQLEDYEMDYNDMYSFSGYSLTYAKCQPVQYFSSDAVEMGSYSPMITEDIVVMRLCPTNSCSDSKEYGCYYNYAEFAIELQDYMGIMLRYASQTTEYMCEYCEQCLNGGDNRNLEEGEDEEQDAEQEDSAQDEDGAQDEEGDDADQQDEKDADGEQGDNGEEDYDGDVDQGDDYYQYACSGWDTYCSDYSSLCVDDENEDGYLDFDGYLDYIECTQVNYNDNNYFIMPRCDGYNNKIKMVAHYDAYCTQASGNDVNIKNFGLGMRDGAFQEFYSGECIDCSESVSVDEVVRVFQQHTGSYPLHVSLSCRTTLRTTPPAPCATEYITRAPNVSVAWSSMPSTMTNPTIRRNVHTLRAFALEHTMRLVQLP